MSEHDAEHDPIDAAYDRAEAMLSDDAARAARRAKVLAAVAAEPAAIPRRPVWRRGGWLAAAGVSGLIALVGTQIYLPSLHQQQQPAAVAPKSPSVPTPSLHERAATPPPTQAAPPSPSPPLPPPTLPAVRALPNNIPPLPRPEAAPASPPAVEIAPLPSAAPMPPPPPPPPPAPQASADAGTTVGEVVVTSEKRRANVVSLAAQTAFKDAGERLRAAAAAGRAAEVEAALAGGAAVDAPDADGNTALMLAVRADRPAVVDLLRRHGADLDAKNKAGETVRTLAAALNDPALDAALGLTP